MWYIFGRFQKQLIVRGLSIFTDMGVTILVGSLLFFAHPPSSSYDLIGGREIFPGLVGGPRLFHVPGK